MLSREEKTKIGKQLLKVAELLEAAKNAEAAGLEIVKPKPNIFEKERAQIKALGTDNIRTHLKHMAKPIVRLTSRVYKKSGFDENQIEKYGSALQKLQELMGEIEAQLKILDEAAALPVAIETPAVPEVPELSDEERVELMEEVFEEEPSEVELENL